MLTHGLACSFAIPTTFAHTKLHTWLGTFGYCKPQSMDPETGEPEVDSYGEPMVVCVDATFIYLHCLWWAVGLLTGYLVDPKPGPFAPYFATKRVAQSNNGSYFVEWTTYFTTTETVVLLALLLFGVRPSAASHRRLPPLPAPAAVTLRLLRWTRIGSPRSSLVTDYLFLGSPLPLIACPEREGVYSCARSQVIAWTVIFGGLLVAMSNADPDQQRFSENLDNINRLCHHYGLDEELTREVGAHATSAQTSRPPHHTIARVSCHRARD
jgi:hypothetical protein